MPIPQQIENQLQALDAKITTQEAFITEYDQLIQHINAKLDALTRLIADITASGADNAAMVDEISGRLGPLIERLNSGDIQQLRAIDTKLDALITSLQNQQPGQRPGQGGRKKRSTKRRLRSVRSKKGGWTYGPKTKSKLRTKTRHKRRRSWF